LTAARWGLLRLLAPMMSRFVVAHDELRGAHDALERRLQEANLRIDRLTEETAAANALAWDQVAIARRLAQLEERLAAQDAGPVPARPSGDGPSAAP
jgi:hypothetical protein